MKKLKNKIFEKNKYILEKYIKPSKIDELFNHWENPIRKYHNLNHLNDILKYLNKFKEKEQYIFEFYRESWILAAFFHDVIYIPGKSDNEEKSIEFFKKSFKKDDNILKNLPTTKDVYNKVINLIEITKYRQEPKTYLENVFWRADNNILFKPYFYYWKRWEKLIRAEYIMFSDKEYKEKRIKFLKSMFVTLNDIKESRKVTNKIHKLIDYIEKKYE